MQPKTRGSKQRHVPDDRVVHHPRGLVVRGAKGNQVGDGPHPVRWEREGSPKRKTRGGGDGNSSTGINCEKPSAFLAQKSDVIFPRHMIGPIRQSLRTINLPQSARV